MSLGARAPLARLATGASEDREGRRGDAKLAFVAGLESPTSDPRIRRVLAGIARTRTAAGNRPTRKRALSPSMVRAALAELSSRYRALVLVALVTVEPVGVIRSSS